MKAASQHDFDVSVIFVRNIEIHFMKRHICVRDFFFYPLNVVKTDKTQIHLDSQ